MASGHDSWRRRVEQGLGRAPRDHDPAALLRRRVVGDPSSELIELLRAPNRRAAVLIGLVPRADGLKLLFTERARHLPHHPGQICFPGGRIEAGEDAARAAMREADEEVGLAAHQVEIVGELDPELTGTGFLVTPVVGFLTPDFEPRPDPAEVASAFEVPFEHLLAPGNRRRGIRERWGTQFLSHEFDFERHLIWGATATILARFIEVIDDETV